MANIKSAIKRAQLSEQRRFKNTSFKSDMRTTIKKAEFAISNNDQELAAQSVADATRKLDQAASRGIIHKNNATRQKSRLMKKLHGMNA